MFTRDRSGEAPKRDRRGRLSYPTWRNRARLDAPALGQKSALQVDEVFCDKRSDANRELATIAMLNRIFNLLLPPSTPESFTKEAVALIAAVAMWGLGI